MYKYLSTHPDLFPAVIGINYSQFCFLHQKFKLALAKLERHKAYSFERIRQPGGGRKSKLISSAAKLFFILLYYKVYPTFRLAQVLFELDKANLYYWVKFLTLVLEEAIGYQLDIQILKAKTKINSIDQLVEICPALKEFLIDATERRIQRSKDRKVQQFYYSGKKKYHTVKNHILVNPRTKRIISISNIVEGKKSDKRLADEDPNLYCLPPDSKGVGDLGYLSLLKNNPRAKFIVPYKKLKGEKLSDFQIQTNREISSIRVRVEHPFAWMKHFNILSQTLRTKIKTKEEIRKAHKPFKNIACLYNFCLAHQ